jgi:Fe2+ or Zn2+ uptake regulation protein
MERGRPLKSKIRQNIIEILYFLEEGYAYDIYKIYIELFPKVTMRSVYYNLNKGVATQEFVVKEIKKEKGEYSWGQEAEKIYYALGPAAMPAIMPVVKDFFEKRKIKK